MSAAINTGGPAFPCDGIVRRDEAGRLHGHEVSATGLSVRDYFAAQALGGMASAYHEHWTAEGAAKNAYELADAMLRAREGGAS